MSKLPRYANLIVSVIGKQISNDGQTLTLETGDGGTVRIAVDPGYAADPNPYVEVVGSVVEPGVVTHFVTRPLGDSFDLGAYDEVITLQQGKYQNLFVQDEYIEPA